MHYLQSAPKSPQHGGKQSAPPRPPHYYNYAQQNNPRPNPNINPMQFQHESHGLPQTQRPRPNPYQTNQLPEDHTIEHIDDSSGGGGGGSNLVTMILIGIVVFVLLGGTGIGAYFLFSHKSSNKASAANRAKGGEQIASSDSDDSGDSTDDASAASAAKASAEGGGGGQVPQTNAAIVGDIFVHQIFFQDTHDEAEFVGYLPQKPFLWNTLSTLDGIAQIFQDKRWKIQKGRSITPHGHDFINLCEYFEENRRNQAPTIIPNEKIDLCGEYHLFEYPAHPLIFKTLLKERQYPHQSEVSLELVGVMFTVGTDRKMYGLTSLLQHMILLPHQRRRLAVPTHLPDTNTMQKNHALWTTLNEHYQGTTYHELSEEVERLQHTVHTQLIHDQTMGDALPYHPGAGPEYNYHLHFGHGGNTRHASSGWSGGNEQQREVIENQEKPCFADTLSKLYFIGIEFRLKTRRTKDDPELEWICSYQNPHELYSMHHSPFTLPWYHPPHGHQFHHEASQQLHQHSYYGPHRKLASDSPGSYDSPDGGPRAQQHPMHAAAMAATAYQPQPGGYQDPDTAQMASASSDDEPPPPQQLSVDPMTLTTHQQQSVQHHASLDSRQMGSYDSPDGLRGQHHQMRTASMEATASQQPPVAEAPLPQQTHTDPMTAATYQQQSVDHHAPLYPDLTQMGAAATQHQHMTDVAQGLASPDDIRGSSGATNAGIQPDVEPERIYLNAQYLDGIADSEHTKCQLMNIIPGYDPRETKKPCKIIEEMDAETWGEVERRRLPECDCFDACGEEWAISHQGKEFIMQACEDGDIRIERIEGVLQATEYGPDERLREYEMLHGEYNRDGHTKRIHFRDIPYWRCNLQKSEGDTYRRRNLMVEDGDDASSALNMDNMYMIIGSTIFCIAIGIQSFYWLSHSY